MTQAFLIVSETMIFRAGRAFVPKKSTIATLQTNHKGFNTAWAWVRTAGKLEGSEAIEIDRHFTVVDDKVLFFSEMGIARIADDMKHNSRINAARKAWMDAVAEVVERCFQAEVKHLQSAPKRIEDTVRQAKRVARGRCDVTGQAKKAHTTSELDGHHLFERRSRLDLADATDNILVLQPELHNEVHSWKGTAVVRKTSLNSSPLFTAISLTRSTAAP